MPRRVPLVLLISLLLSCMSFAKKKNKQELSNVVLNAQTVLVVIHPDAGEPVTNPTANRSARETVENALTKWGRFRLVRSPLIADLVIAVRKSYAAGTTISHSDDSPVIVRPSDGDVRIGGPAPEHHRDASIITEVGTPEDSFEVYLGGVEHPLDSAPVWRYLGTN